MNLADVMDELAERLATIAGLRPFAYPPDKVTPNAAVVTYPDGYEFDATMGRGADRMTVPVVVLVGRVSDRGSRDVLARFCGGAGPESIKAVLEGDGAASFVTMPVGGGAGTISRANRPVFPPGEANPFFAAVDCELVDWTPAAGAGFMAQYLSTFNLKGWFFRVDPSGVPSVTMSSTGANDFTLPSLTPYGFTDGTRHAVGAHIVPNDGAGNRAVTYYTAPTRVGPWTQHGAPVVQAGAITIFGTSSGIEVGRTDQAGAQNLEGKVYGAELRVPGDFTGTLVAVSDPAPVAPGAPAWLDDVDGFPWTVGGDAVVTAGAGPPVYTSFDECRVMSVEFDTIPIGGVDHVAATFAVDVIGTGD